MAKKITRKELLRGTDEFLTLSTRAFQFFSSHQRELKIVGIAVGVAALLYLGIQAYLGHANSAGQEAYNEAYQSLAEKTGPEMNPESLKDTEDLFRRVVEDHGLAKTARLALPQIAFLRFEAQDYDGAITEYRRFLTEVEEQPTYAALAKLGLAACHEAKGDFQTAIDLLAPLREEGEAKFGEAALWSLARLYRLNKNPDQAVEALKAFVETYPDSPFADVAKAQL